MRTRDLFLPLLLSLALTAPAAAQSQPQSKKEPAGKTEGTPPKNPYLERFKELDRNGDGFVTRAEWPLAPASFDTVDRNKDGRLSPEELLTPNVLRREGMGQFASLDTNGDGVLTRDEWQRGGAGYGRLEQLDRNRDGRISLPEFQALSSEVPWSPRASLQEQRQFRLLDRNNDSRISRAEWTGVRTAFERLDRNNDGVISPNEWPRQ
jgi:Ca2+-binding EF-hand superfamily protein